MRASFAGACLLLLASPLHAAQPRRAVFALVVGVNRSVDTSEQVLHYADDDAARYQELFRTLGAHTYLLASFDENTRRLHPQALAETRAPRRAELASAVARARADIALARAHGVTTVLYFIYAGHGNVRAGQGYISLEDARLTGADIGQEILNRVGADENHLIVDACYSFYLAHARGPGGQHFPASGFSQLEALDRRGDVGLLLSTSSARESHEWEGFQAGVFSHEVRSGLYGAADLDGDGQVSYHEIAAFVRRANAAIPNERYRPEIFARPPKRTAQLIDLRSGLKRRVEIYGRPAHYLLEDMRGVRVADFHNGLGEKVRLVRPGITGRLYLQRLGDSREFLLPSQPEVITLAALKPAVPRARARGALHEAFSLIFSLPFDQQALAEADLIAPFGADRPEPVLAPPRSSWRRPATYAALSLTAAALISGVALSLYSHSLSQSVTATTSQMEVAAIDQRVRNCDIAAAVLYGTAGLAGATGLTFLLLPNKSGRGMSAMAGLSGSF